MPDIEFQYKKQSFSHKKNFKNNNFAENNKEKLNDIGFSSNNLNMQTIYENNTSKESNSKDEVEIKNNILTDFCQLEDIYDFCNPRNTIIVKLKKGLRGFGISLCGGKIIEDNIDNETNSSLINQLIRVKKLYPAQPASECGLIDENDFILDVNNHCFVGLTCIEAFNILHSIQDEISLRILKFNYCPLELQNFLYPVGLPKQNNSYIKNTSNYFETEDSNEKTDNSTIKIISKVILIKKDGSLGFTLSKNENEGFFVKQITKEPASLEEIYPGDRILSVNDTSLDGLDLNSAISFLRSLPDLVELKLEKINSINHGYSYNYNDQSDNDDENFDYIKKKQLRYEVKIMLDNRNKDELHNRLKRKDLKKMKEENLNKEIDKIESNYKENVLINYDQNETIEEKKNFSLQNWIEKENCENFFNSFDENNENLFLRQSSVVDFKNDKLNKTSSSDKKISKQSNIIKWRGATLSNDEEEKNEVKETFKNNFVFSAEKKNKEITEFDEQDSGFGESINKTINSSIEKSFNWNCDNSFVNNQETIELNDIQLKLDVNCLVNENSMYKQIDDGLFFYVILDRGWHGRLGFSLLDDQLNDSRFINTVKYGFTCCIVKEIYPNSVAFTNGSIKIGDKLLEVNNQQLINKPVKEVISDLRKMKGKLKLLFLRKVF